MAKPEDTDEESNNAKRNAVVDGLDLAAGGVELAAEGSGCLGEGCGCFGCLSLVILGMIGGGTAWAWM